MKWVPKATNSKATSGYDFPFKQISILSWIKFRMAENQRRGHLTSLSIQIEVNRFYFCANHPNQQSLEHLPFNLFCKYNLQWERQKDWNKKQTKKKPKQTQQKSHPFFIFHEIYLLLFWVLVWFHHRKKIVQILNKELPLLLNSNAKIM